MSKVTLVLEDVDVMVIRSLLNSKSAKLHASDSKQQQAQSEELDELIENIDEQVSKQTGIF